MSATALLGALVAACWLDFYHNFGHVGLWLLPFGVVFLVLATSELLDLFRAKDLQPIAWVVHAGTLAVMLAACLPVWWTSDPADVPLAPGSWPLLGLVVAVVLAFVGEMLHYERPGGVIVRVALSMFIVCYAGVMMAYAAQLRLYGSNEVGMSALLSLVVVAKGSDIGAYFCGRLFGRHKLAPKLSPGKTVEGAVGGLVAACLGSLIVFRLIAPALTGSQHVCPWWSWLSFGVVVALAAMLGDLAESLIKRDMDQKDSSHRIPGLGGVLDFLDSFLFAAPVAYACWAFGWVGVGG